MAGITSAFPDVLKGIERALRAGASIRGIARDIGMPEGTLRRSIIGGERVPRASTLERARIGLSAYSPPIRGERTVQRTALLPTRESVGRLHAPPGATYMRAVVARDGDADYPYETLEPAATADISPLDYLDASGIAAEDAVRFIWYVGPR